MYALSQNITNEVYSTYKVLFDIGEETIPYLEKEIIHHDWSVIKHKSQVALLNCIVTLINDINENHCRIIVNKILKNDCSVVVKSCLNSIISFSLEDYHSYTLLGINILESKELNNHNTIKNKFKKWLHVVPKKDIVNINRIYIIPFNEDYTYSGTYTPILSYIRLVWDSPSNKLNFFMTWINHILIEKTFYHEIGHHTHKHTFGYDENQEKEADDYANKSLKINHKKMALIGKILRKISFVKKKKESYG